jgi:hypothetical protein
MKIHITVALFLFLSSSAFAQRTKTIDQYTPAYFDSIKAVTIDTTNEHYRIRAYKLTPEDNISIDGKLIEQAWQKAEHQGSFVEKEPHPLVDISEETEFAILYDENNLYVGVWSWDSDPEKIVRQLNPRGTASPDNINLFLDTYNDRRTGYKFNISPTGVQGDELRYDDFKRDFNWNGVWYSAAFIDGKGWYAEVKIPFFNLRFRELKEHTFGINIMRNISKDGSRGQWKPHLPEWDMWTRMSTNGQVDGIYGINQGRRFEVRPYALSGMSEIAPDSPTGQLNTGLDVRFSPTSSITADVTVNPDFAQVDADVTEINLTRFPTRFKELRPFFTERTNIFNTLLELFYSRRIGSRGDILGGGKMTGKTGNGYEFGTLATITGKSIFSQHSAKINHQEKANFGVFRIKKDMFNSSSFGILGAFKEQADQYNRVLGIDGSFVMGQQFLLDVQAATSYTESIQSNNNVYYAQFKRTGDEFGLVAKFSRIGPFFEINRIGFMRKESNRGSNDLLTQWRLSPRIYKYKVRIISLQTDLGRSTDIFTDEYINQWLTDNPKQKPFVGLGQVYNNNGTKRISAGTRDFNNWIFGETLSLIFENETRILAGYSKFKNTEVTESYTGDKWRITYLSRPFTKGARFPFTLSYNSGAFYNFNRKHVGSVNNLSAKVQGRLSTRFISSLQTQMSRTFAPTKRRDGKYWRFSSYATFMFTKDFYLRLQLQGNFGTTFYDNEEEYNKYLASALLSWEYSPGSFFYIAYNEGRFDENSPFQSKYFDFNDRTLLVKLSYRFNI